MADIDCNVFSVDYQELKASCLVWVTCLATNQHTSVWLQTSHDSRRWACQAFILLMCRLSARPLKCLIVHAKKQGERACTVPRWWCILPWQMPKGSTRCWNICEFKSFTGKLHMGIFPRWYGWEIINLFIIHRFHSASPHMVLVAKANTVVVLTYGGTLLIPDMLIPKWFQQTYIVSCTFTLTYWVTSRFIKIVVHYKLWHIPL